MSRRTRRLLWAALLPALLLAGLAALPTPRLVLAGWLCGEATYKGLPTSYWGREIDSWTRSMLADFWGTEDPTWWGKVKRKVGQEPGRSAVDEIPAIIAIRGEGANRVDDPAAIPVLIELLDYEGPSPEATGMASYQACLALERFGPRAKAAVPALSGWLLKDRARINLAVSAIHQIGPEGCKTAVPGLIHALKNEYAQGRKGDEAEMILAIRCLEKIGPDAEEAVPVLLELFDAARDSIHTVSSVHGDLGTFRSACASALRAINPKALQEFVVVQVSRLRGDDFNAARRACWNLQEIGLPEGKRAVPALLEIWIKHPDMSHRVAALDALEFLGPEELKAAEKEKAALDRRPHD